MVPLYCSQGHGNVSGNRFCQECGKPLPLAAGQILETRYRIVSQLGQGGFGRTYLAAELHRFNEHCVLKEFAPQIQNPPELKKAKELFEREAGTLYKLDHPQLPRFRELFQADIDGVSCLFLAQDYIEGPTYFDLFQSGRRFSEVEVIQLFCNLLPVLAYIHSKGVIHRDISPDNIICKSSSNLPVLIDFGGVKEVAAISQSINSGALPTRLGKKGYAPEEQLRQGQVTASSDLYSLAVTALVLLTGKEPQELYDSYHVTWRWGQEIEVSPQMEAVLKKMLALQPSDRYQDALAVLQSLPLPTPRPTPANPNVSAMQTIVVAPKAKPVAHSAPSPIIPNANASERQTMLVAPPTNPNRRLQPPQTASWLRPLLQVMAGIGLIVVVGIAGWTVVKSVSRFTQPVSLVKQSSSKTLSSSENSRTTKIHARRKALGISQASFNAQVNQLFYANHPELKRRQLTTAPEDAAFREEWYKIAEDLLDARH